MTLNFNEKALEVSGLTVDFGPFRAVNNVSLAIKKGTITGLIGPNGAGKTTFFNALMGTVKPTAGRITLGSKDITGLSSDHLFASGLARAFQIPRPFKKMSVLENVMLAPMQQLGEGLLSPIFKRQDIRQQEQAIRQKALEILDFVTLSKLADHDAGKISGGQMKLLELARVLMGDPDVILLDEPAAGVNPSLTKILLERIEVLNEQGKTFLVIEHDMDFIMKHCDPIIALAGGEVVFEGTAKEAQANTALLDAYLGTGFDDD